jgi:hypothetical protein
MAWNSHLLGQPNCGNQVCWQPPDSVVVEEPMTHGYRYGFLAGPNMDDTACQCTLLTMFTETAAPLPLPPTNQLTSTVALNTLAAVSHLFKIITPINVSCLHNLLQSHQNCLLMALICQGFHVGFWP